MSREQVEARRWAVAGLTVIRRALWFPALVLALHIAASRIVTYDLLPAMDIPMHLVGGFAIAFFFHVALATLVQCRLIDRPDRLIEVLLLFTLVCSSAVFWEFAEYISDHTIGTHSQRNLEDTLFDMLLGIVGGGLFIVYALVAARANQRPE